MQTDNERYTGCCADKTEMTAVLLWDIVVYKGRSLYFHLWRQFCQNVTFVRIEMHFFHGRETLVVDRGDIDAVNIDINFLGQYCENLINWTIFWNLEISFKINQRCNIYFSHVIVVGIIIFIVFSNLCFSAKLCHQILQLILKNQVKVATIACNLFLLLLK